MADLDPKRVEAAALRLDLRTDVEYQAAAILTADDARAREQGLVATGDRLTVEWVRAVLDLAGPYWRPRMLAALPAEVRAYLERGPELPSGTPSDLEVTDCICPDEEGITPADGCPTCDPVTAVVWVPVDEEADQW